jgi:multisubunit Na+/H+ antiporter MnhE subunit
MFGIFAVSVSVFCLVIGDFGWQNMMVGAVIVVSVMYLFRRQITPNPLPPPGLSLHLLVYAPVLFYYLFIDILKGSWQVIRVTMGFEPLRHPGIIKISFKDFSAYGVGPVGYFITLSPGSFMVDIDWDEQIMLIHVLDASDPDAVRRDAERYLNLWAYQPSHRVEEPDLSTNPEDDDE